MALCNNPTILTVCENGYGKRTSTSDYRLQNRGGSGTINIKTSARNGNVVGVLAVSDEDEIIIFSSNNKAIRMPVNQISVLGRNTQGVRLMRLEESEKIVAIEHIHISDMNDSIPGATTTSNAGTIPAVSDYTQDDNSIQLKPGMKVEVDEVEQEDNQKDEKDANSDNKESKDTAPLTKSNTNTLSSTTNNLPTPKLSSNDDIQKSDNDSDVSIKSSMADNNLAEDGSKHAGSINSSTITNGDEINSKVSASLNDSDLEDEPKSVTDIIEDEDDKRRLSDFFSKGKPKP
jgi:hypothetical protein